MNKRFHVALVVNMGLSPYSRVWCGKKNVAVPLNDLVLPTRLTRP